AALDLKSVYGLAAGDVTDFKSAALARRVPRRIRKSSAATRWLSGRSGKLARRSLSASASLAGENCMIQAAIRSESIAGERPERSDWKAWPIGFGPVRFLSKIACFEARQPQFAVNSLATR
ncbi:MAG TPA: hypothetical protein VNF49_08370, partial [Candidatus Binataceae bacterium]|nr:hypothetical protein [Candidatus Binataceae bacterium]